MFTHTKTLKIAAEMPRDRAKELLLDAYPGWRIGSFAEVEKDGATFYTATISTTSADEGDPFADVPPPADAPEDVGPAAAPDDDTDHDKDGGPSLEKLQTKIDHLERQINKILDAVGGSSDDTADAPMHKHKEPASIPPPIPSPTGAPLAPGNQLLSRVADVSQKEALTEIKEDILMGRIPGVPRTASVRRINLVDGEFKVVVGV